MSAKRIPLPPSVGGGDVVMRVLTVGEYEDVLDAFSDKSPHRTQAALVQASIVSLRGKPAPTSLIDREEWWRGMPAPVRGFLTGYYDRLNAARLKEVDDFFGAAESEPLVK